MINLIIFAKSPIRLYALIESMGIFWKDHPVPSVLCEYNERFTRVHGVELLCYNNENFGEVFEGARKPGVDHLLLTDDVLFTNVVPNHVSLGCCDVVGRSLYMNNNFSIKSDVNNSVSKHIEQIRWLSGVIIRESSIVSAEGLTFDEFKNSLIHNLDYAVPEKYVTFCKKSCCGIIKPTDDFMDDNYGNYCFNTGRKINIVPVFYTESNDGFLYGKLTAKWRFE